MKKQLHYQAQKRFPVACGLKPSKVAVTKSLEECTCNNCIRIAEARAKKALKNTKV